MSEEGTIEIIENEEESNQEEIQEDLVNSDDVDSIDTYTEELAKKHGLVKEEKEVEKEVDGEKDEDEEDVNTDPDNFEEMDKVIEKDEKKFHKTYSSNQKALYFKMKAEKSKKQEIQKERDELKAKLEELSDVGYSKAKLDKISELLKSEDLTVEQLQAVINEKVEKEVKEDKPLTQEELTKSFKQREYYVEQIGLSKHDNFKDIVKLAEEMVKEDQIYGDVLGKAFYSDMDESEVVDKIVKIAKINPKYSDKYKDTSKEVDSASKEKIDRVIKNSSKKISSAAVNSSGSKKVVNFNDLTIDQLNALPLKEYSKVPKEVRAKLLLKAS